MSALRVSNRAHASKRTAQFSIDIARTGTGASDFHDSCGVPTAHGLPKVANQEVICNVVAS